MRKTRFWLPVLLWMLVIFLLSHQDGQDSSRTSQWALDLLAWLGIDPSLLQTYNFGFIVRKLAHMTEYFILALLVIRMLKQDLPLTKALLTSFIGVVLYACTDEFHQSFIPGRVGTIIDVGVDSSGAAIAVLLSYIFKNRKQTKA